MNIYLRELKAHRKAIIIWTISIIIFVAMGMQKYDSMVATSPDGGAEFMKIINSMPKVLQTLWGLSVIDITKPIGYFSVLFFYLALMASIHAGMLGANIISKEERDKTAEFLMTKPVSRSTIITSKLLAALTNVVIVNLVMMASSFAMLKTYTSDSITMQMILSMIGLFLIQLIFMVIGAVVAAIYKNPKKAASITMGILLFTFFLSIIIDMNENFKILSVLTPFKYYDAKQLLIDSHLNIGYMVLTFIIIVSVLSITYKRYKERDLHL
jgi:ABC-2 type transport system permease protein